MFEIQKGKKKMPFNVILHGVPGIGKTSWAVGYTDEDGNWHNGAPNPIVLGPEENDEIDGDRYPIPKDYDELISQVKELIENPRQYKTVVIDTLDAVEKLLHKKILSTDPKQTGSMIAAHGGYAKAYDKAESDLLAFRGLLKQLRDERGMNIILLAHSKKGRATDTILGMEYDTYELALHQKAQALFVDWVSAVLFANYVTRAKDSINSDKVFAMGQGERHVFTQKRPGFLAKNRYGLEFEMPLDFDRFYAEVEAFYGQSARTSESLIKEILGMMDQIKEKETADKIYATLDKHQHDAPKLTQILMRVQQLVGS